MTIGGAVQDRYSKAAQAAEPGLCCPVEYDPQYLAAIPREVLERDYGCGDPVSFVQDGEVVLDLGSGSGKVCFIAAQIAGRQGRVIGVDVNDDMLALARRAQPQVAEQLGYDNVAFVKGRIQDLALDVEAVDRLLREHPVSSLDDLLRLEEELQRLRQEEPLIPSNSVDVIISNCVLNLVPPPEKPSMFQELYRVLKRGGRAIVSDIVTDEDVPLELQQDPKLWSGCYSGAMREDRFLAAFADAGLYGITTVKRTSDAWETINGIEFRSLTVTGYKGKEGPCWDHNEAVVYRGPFKKVEDDDGHIFPRGARAAVCEKTYGILTRPPYAEWFYPIEPRVPVEPGQARPFPCDGPFILRDPQETKNDLVTGDGHAAPTAVSASTCNC